MKHSSKAGTRDLYVSIVVPVYNEEPNIQALVRVIHDALDAMAYPWELVLVDDGSTDETIAEAVAQVEERGEHIRVIELQRNFGQSAAMQAGIDAARGGVIVLMDGDLQNDPQDIIRMVDRLINEDVDVVAGWRKDRKDNRWTRTIPSKLANGLIGRVTGVKLHDYGCTLKVFRAELVKNVRLYGEMHRFIPAWAALSTRTERICEEVVAHHPRFAGVSKYGLSRTFRVLLDLLSVYFFMRYRARPGHFFGMIGLAFGALGSFILLYLAWLKLVLGESIGQRPLLLAGILFVLVAVQFLSTGIIAELLSRVYFESTDAKPYVVRRIWGILETETMPWKLGRAQPALAEAT